MLTSDLQADGFLFDGGQTVTLLRRRPEGESTVTIRNATSGPVTTRLSEELGLTVAERSWSLNALDVGSAGVQPGDVVDDGVQRWTMLRVALETMGTRWHCATRRQPHFA
jgi:hypothetical protein